MCIAPGRVAAILANAALHDGRRAMLDNRASRPMPLPDDRPQAALRTPAPSRVLAACCWRWHRCCRAWPHGRPPRRPRGDRRHRDAAAGLALETPLSLGSRRPRRHRAGRRRRTTPRSLNRVARRDDPARQRPGEPHRDPLARCSRAQARAAPSCSSRTAFRSGPSASATSTSCSRSTPSRPQSIEVLRGPGTALYGSNAMHGTVNVLQASPAERPARGVGVEAGPADYGRIKLAGRLGTARRSTTAWRRSTRTMAAGATIPASTKPS